MYFILSIFIVLLLKILIMFGIKSFDEELESKLNSIIVIFLSLKKKYQTSDFSRKDFSCQRLLVYICFVGTF